VSQHELDMMEVEAPSSMTVLWTTPSFEKPTLKMQVGGKDEVYISPC